MEEQEVKVEIMGEKIDVVPNNLSLDRTPIAIRTIETNIKDGELILSNAKDPEDFNIRIAGDAIIKSGDICKGTSFIDHIYHIYKGIRKARHYYFSCDYFSI